MDDALVLININHFSTILMRVLILVVMDDALVQDSASFPSFRNIVLILVVMDDALVHK